MILILVRFMQIGRARESWQIYHKALARQNKNHSLSKQSEESFFQDGDRTHDPQLASQVLYQMSYPG